MLRIEDQRARSREVEFGADSPVGRSQRCPRRCARGHLHCRRSGHNHQLAPSMCPMLLHQAICKYILSQATIVAHLISFANVSAQSRGRGVTHPVQG